MKPNIKTTEDIMIEGMLWNNQRMKINPRQSKAQLKKKWVSLEKYNRDISRVMNEAFMIGRIYNDLGEKETPAQINKILEDKCRIILELEGDDEK